MTNNINCIGTDITMDNKKLETVRSFTYLGATVLDEGSKPEVLARIAQTTATVSKLEVIWNDMNIATSATSFHIMKCDLHKGQGNARQGQAKNMNFCFYHFQYTA